MNYRKTLWALGFVGAATCAWLGAADPPAAPGGGGAGDVNQADLKPASNDLLEKVQTELHKMVSLEADFDEEVYPKDRKNPMRFSGHLAAKKPNYVIWNVTSPFRTAVLVQAENLQMWDEGMPNGKVKAINLAGNATYTAMAQQTRDWAGGNFKILSESYDVFMEKDKPLILRFVPKARTGLKKTFSSVSVTLTDKYDCIRKIIYRKASGEVYVISLRDPKVNKPIPQDVWQIPPK